MNRYFLELSYKGTRYAGFQKQHNAITVQAEVEKAMEIFFRKKIDLTGSSRTDAGVHALQNYFHFDFEHVISRESIYNLNSILPLDIAISNLYRLKSGSHCRYDAIAREYAYYIYNSKNPFLNDRAWYYPYTIDINNLQEAAREFFQHSDFSAFSKRRTQVKTNLCTIMKSEWIRENNCLVYKVKANRFLRGMVRGFVGTMLQTGRGKISLKEFKAIIETRDALKANFSVPPQALFLVEVQFAEGYFGDNQGRP